MADLLAEEFATIDELMAASLERLSQVKGIGPVMAESVYEYLPQRPRGRSSSRTCATSA